MSRTKISISEFDAQVQPLIGLPVSAPWKGYGSTIFLELGSVTLPEQRRNHPMGEACISVDWDWRIEADVEVLVGSSTSGPSIQRGIALLQGATVETISVWGKIQELAVTFSNGLCLKSMVMIRDNPRWSIRLMGGNWLCSEAGQLFFGAGFSAELSAEESDAFDFARATADRWGAPLTEPKCGVCRDCRSFIRLDGSGHFLDYGVCAQSTSPFDGRVVFCGSGCPAFSAK